MIHFFDEVKLAHKLKNNEVSSKEKLGYFVLQTLGLLAALIIVFSLNLNITSAIFKIAIIDVVKTLVAIYVCHRINLKGDDDRFIERFVCLAVPIWVRGVILKIILSVCAYMLDQKIISIADRLSISAADVRGIGIDIIVSIYTLLLYINSFRIISKTA